MAASICIELCRPPRLRFDGSTCQSNPWKPQPRQRLRRVQGHESHSAVTQNTVKSHPAAYSCRCGLGIYVLGRRSICKRVGCEPQPKAPTELRIIMAIVTDSCSAPIKSPFPHADIHGEARATASSAASAQEKGLDIECCIQDLDPSRSLTVSHVGDCNLECSYCALRWSARRALDREDS